MTSDTVSDPDTSRAPHSPGRGSLLRLALILMLVSVAAVFGGYLYIRNESSEVFDEAQRQLTLIAQLKQSQLEQWRSERLGDGEALLTRNAHSVATRDALAAEPTADSVTATRAWLAGYITAYHQYDRAYLLAADATVRLAVTADAPPPTTTLIGEAREAMRTREVRLVDFYRDDTAGGRRFLALISPVLAGAGGDALGAIVLRIDPATFVWPTLEAELGNSDSAETELMRRDGADSVLVLSPVRAAPGSPLALRLPTTDATSLSAMAVSGSTGLTTAVDHRGVHVLASITPVRNSPWVIVTRIDNAELHKRLQHHLWLVFTGVVLLILSAGAILVLWRNDQRMKDYQEEARLAAAVREAEERLRLALSSASQGLFDLNLLTGEAVTNPEYATMLGYEPAGFTESLDGWRSRLHPDDLARTTAALDACVAGTVPSYHVEFRLRTATGGWTWILAAGQIVARDADGRPKRMLGTHTDITPLKWAQDGQARATAELRNLLAHSPTIVCSLQMIAGRPRLVAISENVERILGYTPLEVMQPDFWAQHAHADDREGAAAAAAAVAAEGQVSHEYRFKRRDGTWAWIQDRMTVVRRDAAGTPLELAGAWSDITQQHASEQARRDSEDRLRLAMTSARQGFWDLDVAAERAVTSPEYAAMLGYDPDTFQETSEAWNQRVHPDDLAASLQTFDDYMAGRRSDYDLELRQRHTDGRWIWIHSVGLAVERTPDGRPSRMIGIHTDVTARKEAELAADRQARLYRTLSLCNEAIVRSATPEELYPQVCRAGVDAGVIDMARVALVDRNTGVIRTAATYGENTAYLDGLALSVDAALPDAQGPVGRAIREGTPFWFDDVEAAAIESPLVDRIRQVGWRAMAAVPLQQDGVVVGALAIYSRAAGRFDAEAQRLLGAMAADVGFALDGFARNERQRMADIRLRQSESRYRSMFADSGMPMLLIDADTGQIADANLAAAAFYGWDVPTLRRMHISAIDTMPLDRLADVIQRSGASARPRHSLQHRLASGEVRDVEAFTAAIAIDDEPRVLAIITDVTTRNAAVRALLEKEHEFTEAQRLAHVGSWTLGRDGRNQWSDEMFRLFGLEARQSVPSLEAFISLVHPDDRPAVVAQMASNREGHPGTPIDYRIVRRDGTVRHVNARAELRTDTDGNQYLAGTVQDLTELRASEAALRIKDRAIESSLNAIAIVDLDGRVTYVNGAFVELWGFDSPASAIGRAAPSLWQDAADAAAVIHAIGEHGHWSGEMRAATGDGRSLDLLVSAVMVAGDSGAPVCMVGAFVDITARKHAEQTLVASLQEKEALLKEVHHRVKNNLQVISSLLRLELGRTNDVGVRSVLSEMQGRIVSMALLHETLYRTDNLAHVDLSTYLTRLVNQIFRSMAPATGRIALRMVMDPAAVDLEQAVPCGLLVNELVSNSFKHAFPDDRTGEVQIALSHVDGGPQLRLAVSDTGPGLPADLAARRERTLGLQLVSDLARQLRGTLTVGDGPGTQFTLLFTPRLATHAGAPRL